MRLAVVLMLGIAWFGLAGPARGATPEEEAARVHFLSGQAYYDQANYEDALREFTEAYRVSHKPALLYNLAICHERLDHFDEAVQALEAYVAAAPDAPDRNMVETRIRNLKQRQKKHVVAPSPAPVAQPPLTSLGPPPPARRRRVATWVVGSLGLGVLAGALASGLVAKQRYNRLQNDCGGGFSCSLPDLAARKSEGSAATLATDVLWPIGTAAVVAAIVLFVYEGKPSKKVHASAGGLALHF